MPNLGYSFDDGRKRVKNMLEYSALDKSQIRRLLIHIKNVVKNYLDLLSENKYPYEDLRTAVFDFAQLLMTNLRECRGVYKFSVQLMDDFIMIIIYPLKDMPSIEYSIKVRRENAI